MSDKLKSAEEYYLQAISDKRLSQDNLITRADLCINAIKEAQRDAIKAAAEIAGNSRPPGYQPEKTAILSLLNDIK